MLLKKNKKKMKIYKNNKKKKIKDTFKKINKLYNL